MSQQPQTPYIGCKISLISMLDIRYEGILYSVNSEKSTIALSKVRSFGTEDRPTMHAVPARDEVYEYIIFKATDIKDLVVCTSSGLDYDPAIISVSAVAEPPDSQPSKETVTALEAASSPSVAKSPTKSQWQFAQPQQPTPQQQQQNQASNAATAAAGATPAAAPAPATPSTRATQGGFGQGRRGNVVVQPPPPAATAAAADGNVYSNQTPKAERVSDFGGGGGGGSAAAAAGGGGSGYRPRPAPQNQPHPFNRQNNNSNSTGFRMSQQGGQHQQQQQQRNMRPMYHHQHQSTGVGGGPVGQTAAAPPRDRIKFDNDFDFEEANEKFKEQLADVVEDLSKVNVSESEENVENLERSGASSPATVEIVVGGETFYDKRTSFFDNISCEALEKTEGKNNRPDWKKERMTNQETFGHSAVRSLAYRRGPRGYSGPGGGGGMQNRYPQQQFGGGGMQQIRYQQYGGGGGAQNNYHHQQRPYGGGMQTGSSNNNNNAANRYRHYNNSGGGHQSQQQPRQFYGNGGGGGAQQGYYAK